MLASPRRALLALAAIGLVSCAEARLSIRNGKVAVTSGSGASDSVQLKNDALPAPITLPEAATLKLSFNVQDGGEGLAPEQSFIVFSDVERDEDVTLQLGVKENGRATFFLDTARPPPALAATSGRLSASLLLSHGADGFRTTLGEITLPSSSLTKPARKRHDLPPRAGEPAFAPQPEITHTFQPDAKAIGSTMAVLGVGAVLFPWVMLLALISTVYSSLRVRAPGPVSYLWFTLLVALEGLILSYWVGLKLYQLLPAFLGLGAVTAYVGTVALRQARVVRLREGGKP